MYNNTVRRYSSHSHFEDSDIGLKYLILNTTEPLIIKNVLNWELLKWGLKKWSSILEDRQLQFRLGKNCYSKEPQFENTCKNAKMTFERFLTYQEKNPEEWLYFDYKYLKDWLTDALEIQKHISWKDFGFPDLNAVNSTIWIGSKGAHTPCHVDSYGCNMIAQVFGKKRWILFPPDEDLQPTRIPYEESSIYSKINFFTPITSDFKNIHRCRTVDLNPGDVLIVPHKWWHYVENIDLAISINTWLALPIDYEERIDESVVHLLFMELTKQLNPEQQQLFLNPTNQDDLSFILGDTSTNAIALIAACLRNYWTEKSKVDDKTQNLCFEHLLQKYNNVHVIKHLSDEETRLLVDMQKNKFNYDDEILSVSECEKDDTYYIKKVLDAVLHVDVVNLIKEKLLES